MDLGLKDKIVCITASARGIGYSAAVSFLKEGATVVLNGRNVRQLQDEMQCLSKIYGQDRVSVFAGNAEEEAELALLGEHIREKFGRLDILVTNLGTGKPTGQNKLACSEWEYMMNINLFSAVKAVERMLSLLECGRNPNVVFISSITAFEQSNAPYAYSAAKAGLLSFAKNLSWEYGSKGIRFNTVVPGNIYFPGGRWEEISNKDPDGTKRMLKENVPLGRFGKAEEIADAVVFMASEKSAFTTGSTLVVDGGQRRGI